MATWRLPASLSLIWTAAVDSPLPIWLHLSPQWWGCSATSWLRDQGDRQSLGDLISAPGKVTPSTSQGLTGIGPGSEAQGTVS